METIEEIRQIPLAQLHESPFNTRRNFNQASLQELADNIKAVGILQPLQVRANMVDPLAPNPDDMFDGYEVVFGHRRLRAAKLAGLTSVPCMVAKLTEQEARRAQIAENLQREDVHPIEEAEGFQALIDQHDTTVEQLIEQTGKSKSYIYGRLKLLNAIEPVRQACMAGKIGAEVALLLARIHNHKLQQKALDAVRANDNGNMTPEDGGAKSFRRIREFLRERFTLDLKEAIFDTADSLLLANAGACTTCPKRSANSPVHQDLVADERPYRGNPDIVEHGRPNLCTDPDCFDAKKKQHLANKAAELQAKGKTVIDGNKARQIVGAQGEVRGGYVELAKVKAALKKAGKDKATVYTVQNPRNGKTIEVVKTEDVPGLKANAAPTPARAQNDYGHAAHKARMEERDRQYRQHLASHLQLFKAVREAARQRARDEFDLRLVVTSALRGIGYEDAEVLCEIWGYSDLKDLHADVATMPVDQLTRLLIDCALVENLGSPAWEFQHNQPERLYAAAAHYGLDAQAILASADTTPAAPAQTSAPAPKGEGADQREEEEAEA